MGPGIDEKELRRRAIDGVRDEVEAFGGGASSSRLIRHDGLVAALTPASPRRSLFNSVFLDDPAVLAGEYEGLAQLYEDAGVEAWTVWVADEDRASAELLADRGHVLDAAPRAMAMELSEPPEVPDPPEGIEAGPCDAPTAAALNDRAYGYDENGFRAALAGETSIRWQGAYADGEPVSCIGAIEIGDDCCITGVATPPGYRGRGIATWLLLRGLAEARAGGALTASLQATRAGAPIYERLGFRDLGFIEMWELRR